MEKEERRTFSSTPMSLRFKFFVGFTVVFSIIFVVAFYWFYSYSTQTAMNRIMADLTDTLAGAIAGIDGDVFEALANDYGYAELADIPYDDRSSGVDLPEDDERYAEHQAWLENIHRIEPRAFPYTYVNGFVTGEEEIDGEMVQTGEVLWVGDYLRISDPEEPTLFLESYAPVIDMPKGFIEVYSDPVPYGDKWGSWVSAYGPIKNAAGEVVGGLGIDFEADYVYEVQKGVRDSMLRAFIIFYVVLIILVFLLGGALTRPIINLTRIAERIAEGDYEQDLSGLIGASFPDEIGTLANAFAIMVSKVYRREQTLRRQVETLKIEIDKAKSQSSVDEIVESDFFKDLQAKARSIRTRREDSITLRRPDLPPSTTDEKD